MGARLIFDLGGIPEREMSKLKEEAQALGKSSFAFAFYMDRCKEERERGVTIQCTTKEFFTENWHFTIIDAPGHRDFIKNMISGAAQADVALLMVPADGNFTTAVQKGDIKAAEIQGQTRAHARLLNLLGVKQIIVGVNKMDTVHAADIMKVIICIYIYNIYEIEEIKDVLNEGMKGGFLKKKSEVILLFICIKEVEYEKKFFCNRVCYKRVKIVILKKKISVNVEKISKNKIDDNENVVI